MIRCKLIRKKIVAHIGSGAAPDPAVADHLQRCARCAAFASRVGAVIAAVPKSGELFLNEGFWRGFDQRLDCALAQIPEHAPGRRGWGAGILALFRCRPLVLTGAVVCVLLLLMAVPVHKALVARAVNVDELYETAMLLDEEGELMLNHDPDNYIDEFMLQYELTKEARGKS